MEVPKQVWTSSIGMALALGVMLIAGVVTTALPCYDLGGTWYEEWYGRRWGSFGTLLFCLCAAGIGFAHVSTANCGRPWARAWVGRDGTLRDALRTALWTCVMWALSLNFALRDGCGSEAGRSEERLASVRFNFVYFCLPFVVGLQFTWLDVPACKCRRSARDERPCCRVSPASVVRVAGNVCGAALRRGARVSACSRVLRVGHP